MINCLARLMAARWLGMGRATEAQLSLTAFIAGVLLLWVPNVFGAVYAVPLLVKAMLSGGGLVLNVLGNIVWARVLREILECRILLGTERCQPWPLRR